MKVRPEFRAWQSVLSRNPVPLALLLLLAALWIGWPRPQPGETPRSRLVQERVPHRDRGALPARESQERVKHFTALAGSIADGDVVAILPGLPDSKLGSSLAVRLAERWAGQDPAAAAAWALDVSNPSCRQRLLAAVAGTWADADPEAARAWAITLVDGSERDEIVAAVVAAAAAVDARRALRFAEESGRRDLVLGCLKDLAAQDPAAAAARCRMIPDEAERSTAMLEMATIWARSEPVAAAAFVVEEIGDDHLEEAVVGLVAQSPAGDLPILREWVETFPEGSLKQRASAEVTRAERHFPSAPAGLPGEGVEDRSPVAVPGSTRK